MQRQADAHRRALGAGEKQAVAAKIVEIESVPLETEEQAGEAPRGKELSRQQVVTLHAGLVARFTTTIYRSKREAAAMLEIGVLEAP